MHSILKSERKENQMNREERAELAEKMYTEDQMILREIAAKLGVSKTTIWKDLKRRNVEMRPGPDYYRNQRRAQQLVRRAERRRANW
jgi:IS30 family transposase